MAMRPKSKVQIYGAQAKKTILVENNATEGAQIGTDLRLPDGTVPTLAQLAEALGVGTTDDFDPLGGLAQTIWSLILEVPIYTVSPISPNWQYTLDGAPWGNVGFAAIDDGIIAGSGAGDLVLAPPLASFSNNNTYIPWGSVRVGITQAQFDNIYFGGYGDGHILGMQELTIFNVGGAGRMVSVRINGSMDAPTALGTGQNIYSMRGSGWNSAAVIDATEIRGVTREAWAPGATGASLGFFTTAVGATGLVERVRVFTDGILTVDGVAATPSHSFLNDTDTGIYRIGANSLGVSVGGTLRFSLTTALMTSTINALFQGATTIELENAEPLLLFDETDAASNERQWRVRSVAGVWQLDTYSDAGVFGESGIAINRAGTVISTITLAATVVTTATATGKAGFRLPHGTAPSSPVNGDLWTTTAGIYVRINGATVGPLIDATSAPAGYPPQLGYAGI